MAVITAPAITAQPLPTTINLGEMATLRVTASGTSPTFQWYFGASGVTANPVSGATSSTFTTPALNSSNTYWARASNTSGSANSSAATVTVIQPPSPPPLPTTFSQWSTLHPFPADKSGVNDDPDGDGIVNLLEFFSGTHPLQATTGQPAVSLVRDGNTYKFIYRRARNLGGYSLQHRYSLDLKTWQTISEADLSYQIVDRGTYEDVSVTLPSAASDVRYYHLSVSLP